MKSSFDSGPAQQKDAHELISDITQLMAEAEEMLSESTSHHAEEKVALLTSRPDRSPERFMEKYISTKERISAIARRTDDAIRACPYESLAIALGIGVLLGASLRWRRDGRSEN
jgi:ElaB/YqjD/DUF883 family membrane-anchored ribosome-binding protein